ncbi:hypothetical protein ABMA70_15705 [Halobacteriovorax sp. XZX-3]|uniref:hypothetical protein n=1 Tax=Halobacteriovorax sp. XZX-3 TaxID=3157722 RepID=UPI00371F094A
MSKAVRFIGGAVQVIAGIYTANPALIASGVGSIAGGIAEQKREDAAKQAVQEQRKAVAINNAQQAIQRQRQIRQTIAEARVRRALIQSRGFEGGPAGAGDSIYGDAASAIGAANTQQAAAFGISAARNRAAMFGLEARSSNGWDAFAGAANLFGQGYSAYKGGQFEGLFGGGTTDTGRTSDFGRSGNNSANFLEFGGAVSGGR